VQARAEDAPAEDASFVTFSGSAALLTDYRFRGVSLSNTEIVVQASLTATTSPGFYASIWGSSLATYGGANTEIDVWAGWTGAVGPFTPNVGVYGYLYPGGTGVSYYELFASVGFALGPVSVTTGINYGPSQTNIGGADNTYVYVAPAFEIPGLPLTIKGSLGYEDGSAPLASGGTSNKVDWMIGADLKYKFITLGVQYIGNDQHSKALFNRSNLDDAVVFSVTASF
jgi:uncharacterized protein (TIGR02001 family)